MSVMFSMKSIMKICMFRAMMVTCTHIITITEIHIQLFLRSDTRKYMVLMVQKDQKDQEEMQDLKVKEDLRDNLVIVEEKVRQVQKAAMEKMAHKVSMEMLDHMDLQDLRDLKENVDPKEILAMKAK